MSRAWLVPMGRDRIGVEGILDCDTVVSMLERSRARFVEGKRLDIDLRGVRHTNSAGLALLLEWTQLARQSGTTLRLHNPPASLVGLAALANVSDLLPVVSGGG